MISTNITMGDLSAITGYTRDKLKGFLRQIGFGTRGMPRPREAVQYSRHELLTIAACAQLEQMGMSRTAIKATLSAIAQSLSGPRPVAKNPRMLVRVTPPSVTYVDAVGRVDIGFVLPLREIFAQIDVYLGAATTIADDSAGEIQAQPIQRFAASSKGTKNV